MGIWIRSQDKRKIIKVEIIELGEDGRWEGHIFVNSIVFGVYSSKEKALKVLDMIEEKIMNINIVRNMDTFDMSEDAYIYHMKRFNSVFQMPQDDEV